MKTGEIAKDTNVPSNDCISRQAAIDALDKRFDSIPMEQTTEILLLRKDLRNLPPAQTDLSSYSDKLWRNAYERGKAEAQQWIPCSERLPEDFTDVLVCYHDKRKGCEDDFYIVQAIMIKGRWESVLNIINMDGLEPVAWIPLPAAYEEK